MTEPIWIEERDVLILHDRLLALHGGASGVGGEGLLKSRLAWPRQHAAYAETLDIVFLAAVYAAAMVDNHPFIDGTQRIGFVLGVLFLELNGHAFTARQEKAANAVIALAAGAMDEHGYAAFLAANAQPVETAE